jgi:hypothetical protein
MNKIKIALFKFLCYFIHLFQFLQGAWYLYFGSIKKARVFAGYNSYQFACAYANKRTKKWKASWDQSGRKQGVFPYSDTSLIVCSKMELKYMGKRRLIKNKMNPNKLIKKAYYVTQPL